MAYKLSGREVVSLLMDIYDKHGHIADQLLDASIPFPMETLVLWHKTGAVSREVTPDHFVFFDIHGNKHAFNTFLFGRLQLVIEKRLNSFDAIREYAVYAPLLKPDTFAIRVAEMNTRHYLRAFGGDDLLQHYFPIQEMLIAYLRHDLHPLVLATGKLDPHGFVTSPQAFASELYHKFKGAEDWQALAHFMINDAKHQGEGELLLSKYGSDRQVYKMPMADACDGCKRLFLHNGHPKLYCISDILHNGAFTIEQRMTENAATVPTFGPSHLCCNCSRPFPLTGMEWWCDTDN